MAYTQDNRLMAISTPLDKDVLLLESIQGSEGISRLFGFELTMLSDNHAIRFDSIIGQSATISIVLPSGKKRFFNGIISRFVQGAGGGSTGLDARFTHYRATLVPWLWLLTRTADCKIFQRKSVPEIVEDIFRKRGFNDFTLKLEGQHPKRNYCVQYRETDFNFVSRLLEEEGICYFFEHIDGKHTMILGDSYQAHDKCAEQETASFEMTTGGTHEHDVITGIERMQEIRPAKYTLNDYNFKTPNTGLKSEVPSQHHLGPGVREIYDYPGIYSNKSDGYTISNIRMEEEEAQITTIIGTGNCRAFTSGFKFTMKGLHRQDITDQSFLLTSIQHHAQQGFHEDAVFDYGNRFTCIPSDVPFRPPRMTPKPIVQGAQTAIVVGPSGEEIHVDKHGRVKVQFHWDRVGQKDDNSSCWIRVSQLWAGAGWGAIYIPRIGQEVIVGFLEGDPDRPIITGRVYHGTNKPPYTLPDEKTKSTLKSNSSKGGSGYNEIRIEDKKGDEQLFIHAEKQQDVRVKEDSLEWIGRDRHLIVKNDQIEKVEGGKHLEVVGDQNEKVGGTVSLTASTDLQQKVGGKFCHEAGMEINLKAGMKVIIEAGTQISLVVGGNFIDIGPAGVTIQGTMVLINSGGAAGSGSGASRSSPKEPKEAEKGSS